MKATITGIIITAVLSLQSNFLQSGTDDFRQKTEFTYSVKGSAGDKLLDISSLSADLQIEGTSGSQIKIVATGYEGIPEKAKGLKPLGSSGEENTGIGLSFNPNGDKISLTGAHRIADRASYVIYMPENMKLKVENTGWQGGDISVNGLNNEVEVKTNIGELSLQKVSGPLVVNSLSSDIKIDLISLSQSYPSSISSTSGDLEITMPASVKGTFKMHSMSGGVYTDFNFNLGEDGSTHKIAGYSATGKLNGGGVEISLRSISGDIYIRKAQ